MKRIVISIGILIVLFLFPVLVLFFRHEISAEKGINTAKKENRAAAPVREKNKIRFKNYIWVEGENATSTNFSKEKTYNFFCSNRYTLQLSKEADPATENGYYANYVFYIPKSKSYDLWLACTPPGSKYSEKSGYASPIEWRIDNGSFRTASSENAYVKKFYGVGGFYWVKISSGNISAGKHNLTIRINQKRSSGWDYFFYIDAILFIPSYSGYLNRMMDFPEIAPEDFNVKGKGIRFENIDYYKKNLKKKPHDKELLFTLAQIYQWLYEYDKAISLYKKILEKDNKNINSRIPLANCLSWSGSLDQAILEYKNVISIDKKNITARKLLAVLAGWNNRYDEAIRNYQEIIKVDPKNIDAYISLATQYTWTGKPNMAIEVFEKAEKVEPDNIRVLYALGDNYDWAGKPYKSINQFKRIIALDEKEIDAYKKLARIYLEQEQQDKAEEIIDNAKRIISAHPELSEFSMDVKGDMEKQKMETIEEYKKSLLKNPENLGVRKNLAETYIWNKMNDEAVAEYNNILNFKVLKTVENTEKKLKILLFELIKLEAITPLIKNIEKSNIDIHKYYSGLQKKLKEGDNIPEELTLDKLRSDNSKIFLMNKRNNILEKHLAAFLDVISIYNGDVRSYKARKDALEWEFDYKEMISQSEKAKERNPGDFRLSKLLGVLQCWFGDNEKSVNELKIVYNVKPERAYPSYPVALARSARYRESRDVLNDINKNLFKGMSKKKIEPLNNFWTRFESNNPGKEIELSGDKLKVARNVSGNAIREYGRFIELREEWEKYLKKGINNVRKVFEKSFLELEISNVRIYNDIANYHLNNNQMPEALALYQSILKVQPLNVDTNYKLGTMNEVMGYWYSALENYELCIDNQPDNDMARKAHSRLQKEYPLSVNSDTEFYSDRFVTRIKEYVYSTYHMNDWLSIKGGYNFNLLNDEISQGTVSRAGVQYYPSNGTVIQNSVFADARFRVVPLGTVFFLNCTGNLYSGDIKYEDINIPDTDINYYTLNYSGGLLFSYPEIGFTVKLGFMHEDVTELTRALEEEITSNTLEGVVNFSFKKLEYPVINRIYLYDSFKFRILSDSNIRISGYNQLSYRLLIFPSYGINLDIYGLFTFEMSKFTEYSGLVAISNTPYWSPDKLYSYGGGLAWKQDIRDVLGGVLDYSLFFQCSVANIDEINFSPGFTLGYHGPKIEAFLSYTFSRSTIPSTAFSLNPEPFVSHSGHLGIKYKFFKIYQPQHLGGKPVILATASPKLITADGDGKDDYTTFSLTAFDKKGISNWELEIFNKNDEKIKIFSRNGPPPASLRWNGTDKAGNIVPMGTYKYKLSINNTAKERSSSGAGYLFLTTKRRAITLETSYKIFSPNDDGVKDVVGIEMRATEKERVKTWTLNITKIQKKSRMIVRKIVGYDFIPYNTQWDGRDDRGKLLDDGEYSLSMTVKYFDKETIVSPGIRLSIRNKSSIALEVDKKILVPGELLRIKFKTPLKQVDFWKIIIKLENGTIIRVLHGSGEIPEYIQWNGTDAENENAGYNIPLKIQAEIRDFAGNRAKSKEIDLSLGFLTKEKGGKKIIYVFNQGILHKGKSEEFTKGGIRIIERLIELVDKHAAGKKIEIIAHTSSDGSKYNNKYLSLKRAEKISDLFKNKSKLSNIKLIPKGESSHFNNDKESKWNSRYEVVIY